MNVIANVMLLVHLIPAYQVYGRESRHHAMLWLVRASMPPALPPFQTPELLLGVPLDDTRLHYALMFAGASNSTRPPS